MRDLGVVAFFGLDGTCLTEAKLAAAWNLPLISHVSTAHASPKLRLSPATYFLYSCRLDISFSLKQIAGVLNVVNTVFNIFY